MAIVLTGSPGVGKHTIANKIAPKLELEILDINKVVLEGKYYEKKGKTLEVDVKKLKKIIEKKIKKNSLLVGHLAPYVISKSNVKNAVILRKSPYKLIPVYKKRKYSEEKMKENLGSEILGVIAFDAIKQFGEKKVFQIDTSTKTITQVTNKVQRVLNGKSKPDQVDWLELVSKKNDFKKFFSY